MLKLGCMYVYTCTRVIIILKGITLQIHPWLFIHKTQEATYIYIYAGIRENVE